MKTLFGIDTFVSEEDRQRWLKDQEERLRKEKEEKERQEAEALAKKAQAKAENDAKLALLSDKGKAIMNLLNEGRPFGCRTPYVRKLMALVIGEGLPFTDGDEE